MDLGEAQVLVRLFENASLIANLITLMDHKCALGNLMGLVSSQTSTDLINLESYSAAPKLLKKDCDVPYLYMMC